MHEEYMQRCLQIAENGLGRTRPNPLVGCIIVSASGEIISEGYHQQCGKNHAERNAILKLKERGISAQGATLYVNLEPCSHYGKTPPCADLIVEAGIGRVVCCNDDPNPLVAGRGFQKLEAAGIEVVRHVLEDKGRWLNRRFFTFIEKQRPYVILKWAESADGYMAPANGGYCPDNPIAKKEPGKQYWISTPQQTRLSHLWRTQEAAILIGSETYLLDHPQLTPRHVCGPAPQPVVLDRRNRLHDVPAQWLHLHCQSPHEVLDELYKEGLQSVIVEGGRKILDAFLDAGLYDEVRVATSPSILKEGLKAPQKPAGWLRY